VHIAVCINHIPDPEAPAKQFRLDERTGKPLLDRVNRVIGPFDENALEVALQLKDAGEARVTALSLGPATNQEALRRALALRCDAAVHVKEDRASDLDSMAVGKVLAAALRKLGDVDLVLCGRQVGDWDGGQVGQILAEELGFSCVTLARQIQPVDGEKLRVTREVTGGIVLAEAILPAVVTVTNTPSNQLRIPKVRDAMAAYKIPITIWGMADLGLGPSELIGSARVVVRRMFVPETRVRVEMITGDDDQQIAERLARRMLDLKVL